MRNENLIVKDWSKIDLTFGLIYPNIYKLGMSSYSIRLLYSMLNSYEEVACELLFLPEKIKYPAARDLTPLTSLRSLENELLPMEFDILGFSVPFENDYRNILWILEKANIPLKQQERHEKNQQKDHPFPLVIAGGPAITSNPKPLSNFLDFAFIGDAEPNLGLFLEKYKSFKQNLYTYDDFKKEAIKIPGIFAPSIRNPVQRSILRNLDESFNPIIQIGAKLSNDDGVFKNNFFLEVSRGCPFQCKFCISSHHGTPFRNKSYDTIIKTIEEGIKSSDFETISLIGSCVSSHPKFREICEYIVSKGKRLSIPSIRIEHVTQEILQILREGGVKTLTIAPETGTDQLRYQIGKKISNEVIKATLKLVKESGIKNVKFYFLIGLPGETKDDTNEIVNLIKFIDSIGFNKGALRININPFVPKLNTPYEKEIEFYLEKNLSLLKEKLEFIHQNLKKVASIKFKIHDIQNEIKNARLQTLLSLGDKETSDILLKYYQYGANFGALRKAESELKYSFDGYLIKIKSCYNPWKM